MVNDRLSKQQWEVGQWVKVGFLTLIVRGIHADPSRPDVYSLTSIDGLKWYEFQPHLGLHRIPEVR